MFNKKDKNERMKWSKRANLITYSRLFSSLALLPATLILSSISGPLVAYIGAAAFCAVAWSTDWVDGFIARRKNARTIKGMLLDQLADKVLAGVTLTLIGINFPYVLSLLAMEVAISTTGLSRSGEAGYSGSTREGKWKTFFLSMTIILGLVAVAIPEAKNGSLNFEQIYKYIVALILGSQVVTLYSYHKKRNQGDSEPTESINESLTKNAEYMKKRGKLERLKMKLAELKEKAGYGVEHIAFAVKHRETLGDVDLLDAYESEPKQDIATIKRLTLEFEAKNKR